MGTPITPVEHIKTSSSFIPNNCETSYVAIKVCCIPKSPVHAFACPEFINIALIRPEDFLILCSQISIQDARTIDCVNRPLQMLFSGANIKAKSFFLENFNPAAIPAKEKPSGVSSPSLTNDQLVSS